MAESEVECRECRKVFTPIVRISARATAKVRCPGCRSADVEPPMPPFGAKTAKKR